MREDNVTPSGPTERRFWGKYRGICKDDQDPLKLGRIRATCPEVLGHENLLDWALPCFPFGPDRSHTASDWGTHDHGEGIFAVPEIDSPVWLEFESGEANRPIWVGVWHGIPLQQGDVPPTGAQISGVPVPKGTQRWETTPHEAWHSQNPDTGIEDYPKEKVWKSQRATFSAFRRLKLNLDLNHDDPVGKAPYISLGLGLPENKPIDSESGHKNKHDIKVQARDIIHVADRDDYTGAGRHVLELAISDIVRQAYANIEDIATEYIRIQSHPDTGSVDQDVSQFGTQFYDPTESAFVHPDDPSQHSTKSIWESTFSDDISKIKMSAHETLILQSRRADIHMSTGKIGDLNTFNDASPPESSEGDDIGRNILAEASNGVVIEAFVRTDSEVAGSGDYQSAKAIHLFHRGPDLPYLSTSNPPIEVGRRWENGVGSNRYLHPNGDAALPVNKTFHRLLDERAAVSFNRHLHPFEFEIQTAEQDVPIEGSFQLTPTWGPPWDIDIPKPQVPVVTVPGYLTPSGLHVLPPDGDDPLYSGAAGDGVTSNTSIAPPVDPYSATTAGGVSGGGAFGMSGDGSPGMAGGPPPGDGAGMAPEGLLGSPAAVQGLRGSIPAPPPHQSTGWAPFNTAAGSGGFLGTLAAIAGTDATPGALGQIGKTLDVILNYLECNHCFEWDTEVTGSENTGFSEFGARWWDPIQEPIEIMVPETGGNSIANSPVYLTNSGVMATTPPVNYSGRQSNPFSPDPQLGGTAAGDPRHYTFGNPVLPDPKYSEYDVLDFGVEYEMEALSQDLGSTALRRMLGPLFGTFQSSVIVPSQTLSWEGDTGPPIAPDRWVPTYHTPEDAWGTSVPGVITGPIPYPGALEEGSIPCMTEFTRAN